MSRALSLRNRQRIRPVDAALLRRITRCLLSEHLRLADFELCLHLVAAPEMAWLNECFLKHAGPTDVITFDYANDPLGEATTPRRMGNGRQKPATRRGPRAPPMRGELFICLDEAVAQARQFRTTWQREVVRYVIHGLLHLRGYDDLQPACRHLMRLQENRLLRQISRRFCLTQLGTP
ncbi:MAG: rRNA maturation RNase YbeY [Verrucomicrobia bacterium]|nr:MAG: rRNA maturation RNase YbeY [Verrucomicrobiota bacterium]